MASGQSERRTDKAPGWVKTHDAPGRRCGEEGSKPLTKQRSRRSETVERDKQRNSRIGFTLERPRTRANNGQARAAAASSSGWLCDRNAAWVGAAGRGSTSNHGYVQSMETSTDVKADSDARHVL